MIASSLSAQSPSNALARSVGVELAAGTADEAGFCVLVPVLVSVPVLVPVPVLAPAVGAPAEDLPGSPVFSPSLFEEPQAAKLTTSDTVSRYLVSSFMLARISMPRLSELAAGRQSAKSAVVRTSPRVEIFAPWRIERAMHLHTAAVLGLVLCVGSACEKDVHKLDASDFPASADDPAIIEVTSAGSGAQHPLRLAPAVDSAQTLHLDLVMGGLPIEVNMGMDMSSKVIAVHDDGSYDVESTIDNVVLPEMGADTASVSDMLKGVKTTTTMSARGGVKSGTVNLGTGLEALNAFSGSMEQLGFALPEEPVAIGASWTTRETLERNGVRVFQEIVYEITALGADSATMKMTLHQRAPKQTITMVGQEITYDSLESKGSGTLGLVFSKPMPVMMSIEMSIKTKVSVGGQTQKVDTSLTIAMTER